MLMYFKTSDEFLDDLEEELKAYFNTAETAEDMGVTKEQATAFEDYNKEKWQEPLNKAIAALRGKQLVEDDDVVKNEDYWVDNMPTMFIETSDLWDSIKNGDFDWGSDMLLGELLRWLQALPENSIASGQWEPS